MFERSLYKILVLLLFLVISSISVHASEKRFVIPIDDSPSQGPASASVTMIKFLDYQ